MDHKKKVLLAALTVLLMLTMATSAIAAPGATRYTVEEQHANASFYFVDNEGTEHYLDVMFDDYTFPETFYYATLVYFDGFVYSNVESLVPNLALDSKLSGFSGPSIGFPLGALDSGYYLTFQVDWTGIGRAFKTTSVNTSTGPLQVYVNHGLKTQRSATATIVSGSLDTPSGSFPLDGFVSHTAGLSSGVGSTMDFWK